ncbi:fibronectin type III domain-containing protein [Candidatus Nitrospira neomarina]|uniref:Fibronectin type III domain-containing protein n=1 Tax=Candidatus Nitrospira neomarina TaxID=3020899 RepID=A0AA96GPF3_9BACT|nr:fibronectin type III domain-containing protein [Candidatus Nitrospira neomarina]WNM63965.1 fibronectin type III domain-containing protein [Candidatus Nitrospira neomarina]
MEIFSRNMGHKRYLRGISPLIHAFSLLLCSLLLFGIVFPQETNAGILDNLKAGEWYEVPNSKIRALVPSPIAPGNGPENIILAWNSGAYDTKRDRYLVTGGGHNDYGGNEIYAFNMNTLAWSIAHPQSPNIPAINGPCSEIYPDGKPAQRHTYDGLEYLPNVDKFWMHGGSLHCGTGSSSQATWMLDFNTLQWQQKAKLPYDSRLEMVTAFDPSSGHVFMAGQNSWQNLLEYDPISDKWTVRSNASLGGPQTATIDSKRRLFVSIGGGNVFAYNLNNSGIIQRQTLSTSGATNMVSANYPGVDYDPVSDRIVAWHGGANVYTLNMDTLVWTKHITTNSVIPTSAPHQGTFNRWRYVPSKNVFIVVNSIDENVYIYKLSTSGNTPTPPPPSSDTTPPSIPSALSGSAISSTQINLSWTASTDNVGVAGYKVFRNGTQVNTPSSSTTYLDTGLTPSTSYSYMVSAFDLAGNNSVKSTAISVATNNSTSTVPPPTGQINIPTGVFVALDYPDAAPIGIQNSKHVTWAHNPIDGRLYSMGGDFGPGDYPSSYRQDMYSLSISDRWANKQNRNAGWRQEYPYCGPDGGIQPKSPDFVGWTWDSTRKVFWMVPGTMVTPVQPSCPGRTTNPATDEPKFKFNHIMTFNPAEPNLTKRWLDWGEDTTPHRGEKWMSIYDAKTDTIIRFGVNQFVDIYDVKTRTWSSFSHGNNAVGDTVRIFNAALSVDFKKRVIFAVDEIAGRLMRWNMDAKTMTDLGPVPDGPIELSLNSSYSAWDSINNVLFFLHPGTLGFHVYHPETKSWETPAMVTDPPGLHPDVKHAIVFDPYQNVLAFLGNRDDANPYIYLYRYAAGGSNPGPGDTIPPSPPTQLKLTIIQN